MKRLLLFIFSILYILSQGNAQPWIGPDWYVSETIGNDSTGDGSATYPFLTVRRTLDEISALSLLQQDTIFISGKPPDDGAYYHLSNPINIHFMPWGQATAYIQLQGIYLYLDNDYSLHFNDIVFNYRFRIEAWDYQPNIYLYVNECKFNNRVIFEGNMEGIVENSVVEGEYWLDGEYNQLVTKNNIINGDLWVQRIVNFNPTVEIEENEINGNVNINGMEKRLPKQSKITYGEILLVRNRIRGNLNITPYFEYNSGIIEVINNIIEGNLFQEGEATLSIINNSIIGRLKIDPYYPEDIDLTIRNNVFYSQNGGIGIDAPDCNLYSNFNVEWNNIYGFDSLVTCLDTTGLHLTSFNPYFADSLYHLYDVSPAIDAGDPAPSYNDVDGTRNDLGAYGGPGGEIYNYPNRPPDWYVSETMGNDSTGDGSQTYPFQTVRKALDEICAFSLSPKDTILISGKPPDQGTYYLSSPINVHFTPWNQDTAYIELSAISADLQNEFSFLQFHEIVFDHNIDIRNEGSTLTLYIGKCVFKNGATFETVGAARYLSGIVENSLINGNYQLYADGNLLDTRRNTINGNLKYKNTYPGGGSEIEENEINGNVDLYTSSDRLPKQTKITNSGDIYLRRNRIRGNLNIHPTYSFGLGIYVNNNIIEGNLFLSDGEYRQIINNTIVGGLKIVPDDSVIYISQTIENNIFYSQNGGIGIDAPNCNLSPDFLIEWNNLYGFDTLTCLDTTGLHLTSFNPYFADSLYHLYDVSPAIDAGDPNSGNDVDGTRNDLGRYGGPGGESYAYPVFPNNPPSAFNLISPLDGDTLNMDTVKVLWHHSSDPDSGDSVIYEVEWSLNSDYSTSYNTTTSDSFYVITDLADNLLTAALPGNEHNRIGKTIAKRSSNSKEGSLTLGNHYGNSPYALPDSTTIYWRVKAYDRFNVSTWANGDSTGWSFTVMPEGFVIGEVSSPTEVSDSCSVTVGINVDMNNVLPPDTLLGSFTATLEWEPTELVYVSHSDLPPGFVGVINTTNVDSGIIIFNGANPYGASGFVNVLNIDFNAIGSVGISALLDLEFSSIAAAYTFNPLDSILIVNDDSLTITAPEYLGDVNCDGQANSTDALIILSYDAGLQILEPCTIERLNEGFGDVNSDGSSNSLDALIIISYDVGIPVPFPVGEIFCPN